jgi:membrane-associated protease RseP (regulator of RpoE activity)
MLKEGRDGLTISIGIKKGRQRRLRPLYHWLLLGLTTVTMTWAGLKWWSDGDLLGAVLFAVALMAILGLHELGHALMARRRGIDATIPFFIPAPPQFPFGTFGAVIFMNSPVPNRKALLDVGIAGPLAGFILSLPVVALGLKYSTISTMDAVEAGEPIFLMPLVFQFMARLILGPLPENHVIEPHPIAMAGWAGLFVTSLNLLPMGQLDGGHIIRGILPGHYRKVYGLVAFCLLLLGFFWPGWFMWVLLIYLMTKFRHPGPLDDVTGLDGKRRLLALVSLVILVLSFMPVPVVPAGLLK